MADVRVRIDTGRIAALARAAAKDALAGELAAVFARSQALVPVDTGALKASGYVEPPEDVAGGVEGRIGYDTDYALKQHENLSYRHPHGGQAKYLEAAFHERSDGMAERIGRAVAGRPGR